MGSIISIGIASGPALGGIIIGTVGWRWVFLVNLPIGLAALAMVSIFVPPLHTTHPNQIFDLPGAGVMFFTLGAFAAAMTLGQDAGFGDPLVLGLLVVSALGLAVFVFVEQHSAQPMVDLSLFNDFLFNINLFMGLLVSTVLAGLFIPSLLSAIGEGLSHGAGGGVDDDRSVGNGIACTTGGDAVGSLWFAQHQHFGTGGGVHWLP